MYGTQPDGQKVPMPAPRLGRTPSLVCKIMCQNYLLLKLELIWQDPSTGNLPRVGEHTVEVLLEYGLSAEQIGSLCASNAIHQQSQGKL